MGGIGFPLSSSVVHIYIYIFKGQFKILREKTCLPLKPFIQNLVFSGAGGVCVLICKLPWRLKIFLLWLLEIK